MEIPQRKGKGMYETIDDVVKKAEETGSYFFSKESMSWFNSRLHHKVYQGRYFITSERDSSGIAWDGRRRYTLRAVTPEGAMTTVGYFGQYHSLQEAIAAAKEATE